MRSRAINHRCVKHKMYEKFGFQLDAIQKNTHTNHTNRKRAWQQCDMEKDGTFLQKNLSISTW